MKSSIITEAIKTARISLEASFGKTSEKLSASETAALAQPAVFFPKMTFKNNSKPSLTQSIFLQSLHHEQKIKQSNMAQKDTCYSIILIDSNCQSLYKSFHLWHHKYLIANRKKCFQNYRKVK